MTKKNIRGFSPDVFPRPARHAAAARPKNGGYARLLKVVLLVSLDHLLHHLAADRTSLTGSQIAVVALLQIHANLAGSLHLEAVQPLAGLGNDILVVHCVTPLCHAAVLPPNFFRVCSSSVHAMQQNISDNLRKENSFFPVIRQRPALLSGFFNCIGYFSWPGYPAAGRAGQSGNHGTGNPSYALRHSTSMRSQDADTAAPWG